MPYLLDPDKFNSSRPIRHTKNGVTKPKCDPGPKTFGNLGKISYAGRVVEGAGRGGLREVGISEGAENG